MNKATIGLLSLAITAGVALSVWQRGHQDDTQKSWTFTQLGGESVSQGDYIADKVLINFWASWCPPCVRELPLLDSLAHDTAESDLAVLAVAMDSEDNVRRFLSENPLTLDIALGFEDVKTAMTEWGNDTGALPFTVLLDSEGNVIKKHLGELLPEALDEFVSTP